MAGLVTAIKTGISQFIGGYRRFMIDPNVSEGGLVFGQGPTYDYLWKLYEGSAFEDMNRWNSYKGQHRLYRQTRQIFNPVRNLADFYAERLYPGMVTAFPDQMPDGTAIAIPLTEDTTPEMRAGLDQLWQWTRWRANKSILCRFGAIAGSVLVEVTDDYEAGRVGLNIVWPAHVAYLDLDQSGAILAYALQYVARDDDGISYTYRKEVDADWIRFYYNGIEHDYGDGMEYRNPYGFVPAVWCKHKDLGDNNGAPAIYGSFQTLDELCSLSSHIHDQVHKVIGAPVVLWSDGGIGNLFSSKAQAKGPPTNPYDVTDLDREGILMLKGPSGGKVDHLAGNLPLHESLEHVQLLLTQMEQSHPEITMYRQLRAMSQVTGPAAERLMGDVVARVDEAAANYDDACSRVFAMALCIGGWRANRGDWGPLSPEQQVFTPFNVDQYGGQDMHIRILPRPLLAMSQEEALQLEQLRATVKAAVLPTLAGTLRENIPS